MESPEDRTPGDSMNSKERIGVKLEFINLPIYKKTPQRTEKLGTNLKLQRKSIIFWTCPKEFCGKFLFYHIHNVILQNCHFIVVGIYIQSISI